MKITYRKMQLERISTGIEIRDRNGNAIAVATGWDAAMKKVDDLMKYHTDKDRKVVVTT